MDSYPNNSNYAKESKIQAKDDEPKKIEKVIVGDVIRRKKPLGKRFAEIFVSGDSRSVGSYLLYDVLLPATKDTIADLMTQGVERMLFGETRSTSRRMGNRRGEVGHVNYSRYSSSKPPPWDRQPERQLRPLSRKARSNHDFDEVIIKTRAEAEEVIDQLFNLINRYQSATVADLYELIGENANYTDDKWGWTDLRNSRGEEPVPVRVTQGYLLNLPKPEPLD